MDILLILGLICASYLWAGNVTFIEDIKNYIGLGKKQNDIKFRNKIINFIWKFIHKQFNCYCLGFWITWIISGSIWLGFIVYVSADIIYSFTDYLKNNTYYN